MQNKCLFCSRSTSDRFTDEHIIPKSLLLNASEELILKESLCKECNCSRFGSRIDSVFLSNIPVRILRIVHKDFIPKDKIPAVRFKEFRTIRLGQYDIPLDLIINGSFNESGALIVPTNAPIANRTNSKEMILLRRKEDIASLNAVLDKKKNYRITNRGTKFIRFLPISHEEFFLKMGYALFKEMTFTRFIVKIALEYLAKEYGSDFIFRSEFADYHPFIMHQTDKCQITYRLILQRPEAWPDYIKHLRTANFVTHTLGLKYDEDLRSFYFFFNLFDKAAFQLVLPTIADLREKSIQIKSFRAQTMSNSMGTEP